MVESTEQETHDLAGNMSIMSLIFGLSKCVARFREIRVKSCSTAEPLVMDRAV